MKGKPSPLPLAPGLPGLQVVALHRHIPQFPIIVRRNRIPCSIRSPNTRNPRSGRAAGKV